MFASVAPIVGPAAGQVPHAENMIDSLFHDNALQKIHKELKGSRIVNKECGRINFELKRIPIQQIFNSSLMRKLLLQIIMRPNSVHLFDFYSEIELSLAYRVTALMICLYRYLDLPKY